MAIIKTLDILLRGRTDKLKSDMDKGKAIVSNFAVDVKGLLQNAFAGVSTAVIVSKFRSVINAIDDLGDRAKVFGTNAEELGKLEYAAEIAAVSYDKLAMASKFMTLNIAKAKDGVEANVLLFKKLGTTGQELGKLSLTERFLKIAQGLGAIEDQSKKTELSMKLFGKQGLFLLPLLADNGRELTKVFSDLDRYGTVFSQRDAETLGDVNDAFALLSKTFNAVFGRIAVQMAPALKNIARNLSEAIKPGTFLNGVMRGLGDGLTIVIGLTTVLTAAVRAISELFGSWTGRVVGLIVASYAIVRITRMMVTVYTTLRKVAATLFAIEAARAALNALTAKQVAIALGTFIAAAGAIAAFEAQISQSFANVNAQQEKMLDGLGGISGNIPAKLNVESAAKGSQQALQQLFGVTVSGPMDKMIEIQNAQLEVQQGIRDGINGLDGAFGDIDEQGAF